MIEQNMTHFINTQKQKQLLMKVTLMMYLNQFMLQLYKKCKNVQEKVKVNSLAGSSYIKLPKELDHPR